MQARYNDKVDFCHFFDMVTKLDLTRRLPKRSNVPDFDGGIRRGLPGLHNADNEKVLPGLHHSSKSTFLKFLDQKIKVSARKWPVLHGCLTDIHVIDN